MSDTAAIDIVPNTLRTTLYSPEAEQAVLGCVFIDPGAYYTALARIKTPDDFYIIKHRWIWEAFGVLTRGQTPIDVLTVAKELERRGQLEEVGGVAYLACLINTVPTSLHVEAYASIVEADAFRRKVLEHASASARLAHQKDRPVEEIQSDLLSSVNRLVKPNGNTAHVSAWVGSFRDKLEDRLADPKDVYGVATGFADFDRITGGLQKGETLIVTGDPGAGKTQFALQTAFQAAGLRLGPAGPYVATGGRAVALYELEMSSVALMTRMISGTLGIEAKRIRSGRVSDEEIQRIARANAAIQELPVYVSESTAWTTAGLRADLTRLVEEYGVELCVIDYLKLLKDRVKGEEHDRINHISTELHGIAKDLNLALLVVHSLTKSGIDNKSGKVSDMAGGAQVGYDANIVVFMGEHIPEVGRTADKRLRTMTFGKFREGNAMRLLDFLFVDDKGVVYIRDIPRRAD